MGCSSRSFPFSFTSSHFLTSQTPSEDDNLEDEWLEPHFLGVEGYWSKDLRKTEGSHVFNTGNH